MREKKSGKGQKKALSSRERQFHKWNNKLKHRQEAKELESYKKAKILKKYAKLCAEEGVESHRVNVPTIGGNGKKSDAKGTPESSGHDSHQGAAREESSSNETKNSSKRGKPMKKVSSKPLNSFQKAQKRFNEESSSRLSSSQSDERGGKGKKEKNKRVHGVTKKGQPVMRHHITRMLESLQSEAATE